MSVDDKKKSRLNFHCLKHYQFSLKRLFFSRIQEAAQSPDMALVFLCLSSSSVSVHPLGRSVFQFQPRLLPRPPGIQLPVFHATVQLRVRQTSSRPSSMHAPLPSRTLFHDWPSLFWGRFPASLPDVEKEMEALSKSLILTSEDVCQRPRPSLLTPLCLLSGWTLTPVWPSLHFPRRTLLACET